MSDCICDGNLREIVNDNREFFDRQFRDTNSGRTYTFFGIVIGSDDYYYGMSHKTGPMLLSCVGSIEGYGFELVEPE